LKAKHGKSPRKRGGAKKDEDDNEEEDDDEVVMPGDIQDKDEERGKPPIGAPDNEAAVKEEESVEWTDFGENKEGQMHGL
jgi:hypothetical protein